jgi:hypothetical protein
MKSIFTERMPAKPGPESTSVTPMTGRTDKPIVPDPMGSVRHVPNADKK